MYAFSKCDYHKKSNYSSHNNKKESDVLFRKMFDLELNLVRKESVVFTELEDVLYVVFS